jgi:hypothetical protein
VCPCPVHSSTSIERSSGRCQQIGICVKKITLFSHTDPYGMAELAGA